VHRSRPVVVLAFVALAPACLLTTSFDGLTGDAVPDAAPVPAEAAVDAGGVDAPIADSVVGDVVDAARPFRCAEQTAVFCADFDTDPFDVGFNEIITEEGGSVVAGSGRFGRGLVAQIPLHGASNTPAAIALKVLDGLSATTSFTYAFDILIEPAAGAGYLTYAGFFYNGPYYEMNLRSDDEGRFYLHEYADAFMAIPALGRDRLIARGPVPGTWTHVVMKVTFSVGSSKLKLMFDDDVMMDDAPIDAHRYASTPKIPVGIYDTGNAGKAVKLTYDDVIVTTP
jgi:hypothetical protein